jgi:hypothetical protein
VVLVALVVLAALVVPALMGRARQGDLDGAAARVAASARFARDTAVSRGVTVVLAIETEPGMIRLAVEEEDTTTAATGAFAPVAGASMRSGAATISPSMLPDRFARIVLPARVTAHLEPAIDEYSPQASLATGDGLRFPPDGRTEGGVVVLSDMRGRERRILVAPGTGQVVTEMGGP